MFKKISAVFLFFLLSLSLPIQAMETLTTRFFYSGDGKINLRSNKTKAAFGGTYRSALGEYNEEALRRIAAVWGSASHPEKISLRLIEFLDYLQDHFKGGTITITSGYRSPSYNLNLRKNGALAGKASLHQYGMAADLYMAKVPSRKIWEYVRELKFGGAGYYHGKNVHLDVGPARWWDEKTSKVDTDIADDNKLIILVPDRDIYLPGETISLNFARMTAWPIGVVPEFLLERTDGPPTKMIKPLPADGKCHHFKTFDEMQGLKWTIPVDQAPGRYRIKAKFCEKVWEAMPDEIATADFVIHQPPPSPAAQTPTDKF